MKYIQTDQAPSAIGPYSQAIDLGNLVYTSGQIPLTAKGELVSDEIREQTHQVIQNVRVVLEAAGSSLDHVVKTTLFIKDINDFPIINEIYASYFAKHRPARSCVEVSRLPKDVLIEMEVIAKKKD